MTDLTTLFWCITILIVCFSLVNLYKWDCKQPKDNYIKQLEEELFKSKEAIVELKEQLRRSDILSDINEGGEK